MKKWMVSKKQAIALLGSNSSQSLKDSEWAAEKSQFTPMEINRLRAELGGKNSKPEVIAVHHTKGGVGKTTVAFNTASYLAAQGWKVLLVDLDPSGGTTKLAGKNPSDPASVPNTMLDVFKKNTSIDKIIFTPFQGVPLDVVPCSPSFTGVSIYLAMSTGKDTFLKRHLKDLDYDFIIIDAAPNWDVIHTNIFLVANHVIAPTVMETLSVMALEELRSYIEDVLDVYDIKLPNFVILPNMMNHSVGEHKRVLERVKQEGLPLAKDELGEIVVPQDAAVKTANEKGLPIIVDKPSAKASYALRRLANLLVTHGEN